MAKRFYKDAEPIVWAHAKLMVKSLFRAGHSYVILDATSITKFRRDEWIDKDWVRLFKHIPTSKEECIS